MLIILKVNIDLSEFIPELLLTGTHPSVAGIEDHDVLQLVIHQVHYQVIVVFSLRECLRQREQLPEPHPLRLLVLGERRISVFEMLKQPRVSYQLTLDVDLGSYQRLNRIKLL